MDLRRFGSTDLLVSPFGLGCARIGGIFKREPREFLDLLGAARDAGITFFDTADMYSQGESERLVGQAFRRGRDRVTIASKVGYVLPAQRRLIASIKPLVRPVIRLLGLRRASLPGAVRGALAQDFSPAYVTTAVEASLRRLGTDHLDLLQLHSPPASVVAAAGWLDALEQLKRAGKIRFYGVSCDTQEAAEAALGFGSVSSLQLPISLLSPDFAHTTLPRARERRVAVIARECLANGLLVKPEHEVDERFADLSEAAAAERRQRLRSLRQTAQARSIPLSRLALEYVTQLEGVSVSLIGASRPEQLRGTLQELGV